MFLLQNRKNRSARKEQDLTDEVLVARYLETGNKELIAVLFERYTHLVYGICLKYLNDTDQCKDAVMEIFEGLFQKLAVHQVANFRNWLYTVTRNHCLMAIRKSGSFNKAKDGMLKEKEDAETPEYMTEDDDGLRFNKALIMAAVDQLNPEQGTCIRLMYLDDKSYRDIVEITGFTMNEVKSYIQNGKRNLKNYLCNRYGNSTT